MNITITPQPGQWTLAVLPRHEQKGQLPACIAQLALDGPVVVLDGGMLFNVYRVVMASHGQNHILNRIRFARAFTCYQMVALLERTLAEGAYAVVMDLLSTFQDENVPASERMRLLKICLPHLKRLSQARGALVSVGPLDDMSSETQPLFRLLEKQATQVYEWSIPSSLEQAPRLF